MPRKRKPKLSYHKATRQWYVRIRGKIHYLGMDEIKAQERRRDLLKDWLYGDGDIDCFRLNIDDLCSLYSEYANGYYRKGGAPTSEVNNIRVALRPVVRLFGNTRAREFGPVKLKQVRQAMIDAGCVRTSINRQIGRIRRMFRWAAENEFIPSTVYSALATVAGLRNGRSDAIESELVTPVSDEAINAVEPYVSRPIWAMIRLQILTGMRPGEVRLMRGCDLNMSGRIWEYVPQSHKTQHQRRQRVIFIGPKAQAIVREFLKPNLQAYLFSPADSRAEFDAKRKAERQSPMTPSQRARRRKARPKKSPRDHYSMASYGQAIRKACERAFGMPEELRNISRTVKVLTDKTEAERKTARKRLQIEASKWRKEHCWHAHQLRHNAATMLRREFGIEAARTVLGHASAAITEVYAEMDMEKAKIIMSRIG